jgi:hypothetical protein
MLETIPRLVISQLSIDADNLVAEYSGYQKTAGYIDSKTHTWGARAFLKRYPDLESWREASLEEQLGLSRNLKYFANFLFIKHYLRPTLPYLLVHNQGTFSGMDRCGS